MEELDFSGLLANCSDKGRTGYNPIMMYAVVTYANMRGLRAVDRIVELCEQAGYTQVFEVYGCADCSGCEHKAKCLYNYNAKKRC